MILICTRGDLFNLRVTVLKMSEKILFCVYAIDMPKFRGGFKSGFLEFENTGGYFETSFNVPTGGNLKLEEVT